MDCPSNSSRKRPRDALAGASVGGAMGTTTYDDVMVRKKSSSNDGSNIIADRTEKKGEDMHGNCSDDYCVVDQSNTDYGDPDTEEDEDIPEIIDLQKALEYLVSERDIEHTYNNGDKQTQHTTKSHTTTITESNDDTDASNEQLYMIPNLVNRIIMEHYSSSTNHKHNNTSDAKNYMSRKQRDKLTKLLVAVIVEFAEPYFVRMAQYKKLERDKLLLVQQQKKQMQTSEKKMTKKKLQSSSAVDSEDKTSSFDERAISWATSCIKQLLQTPSSSSTFNITNKKGGDTPLNDHLDDGHMMIPELDALLSASGEHDGMEMEECMQSALLQGLQGRRLLQSMGISFVGDSK